MSEAKSSNPAFPLSKWKDCDPRLASPSSWNRKINLTVPTAHHIGWIVAGCFTIIAAAISFWLVNKHLQWYTNKREQRHIVRILFMVPIYAIISFASYLWWNHATPIILIRDGYESTVLTAFFYLLLVYLSPDSEEQRRIFMKRGLSRQNDAERIKKGAEVQRWVFPLGFITWKPADGLYFLQLMKWGVLQYCVLRPLTTFIAVLLEYMGLYCESSWSFGWGYVYITIIVSLSVTVAMYCLIQLYVAVSKDLARHKPLLKLFAIKAVVFLTFWQATFLSILSMFGVVKDTQYMTAEDINIGIGALLETFEMMLFALLHVRAFTYKVYRPYHDINLDLPPPERTPRLKSLGHAMDFRETFRELWVGCVYMWHRFRGKEPAIDSGAIRAAHYEVAFGKHRFTQYPQVDNDDSHTENIDLKEPTLPQIKVEVTERVEVDIGGEKQWLGTGDDYGYGLKFRERSEGLEEQIEKELEKRGYALRNKDDVDMQPPRHPKQKSWWRSIYHRISHTDNDERQQVEESRSPNVHTHRAVSRSRTCRQSLRRFSGNGDATRGLLALAGGDHDLEDQPPPSLIARKSRREVRHNVERWRRNVGPQDGNKNAFLPLPVPPQGYSDHRRALNEHRQESGRQSVYLPTLVSPVSASICAVVDPSPRQQKLTSLDPERRLERIFESTVNDPPAAISRIMPGDAARSDILAAEGDRLSHSTPPIRHVPSQPSVFLANQLVVAAQRRSTKYHLADGEVHVPMTADVVGTGSSALLEREDRNNITSTPFNAHQRESAIHRTQDPDIDISPISPRSPQTPPLQRSWQQEPVAGPSRSPVQTTEARGPTALRRSSAQYDPYRHPYRKRQSLPSHVEIPYPSSPSFATSQGRQPYHSRQSHDHDQDTIPTSTRRSHSRKAPPPISISSPRNYDFPPSMRSPASLIDDGFSRYPVHLSTTYPKVP